VPASRSTSKRRLAYARRLAWSLIGTLAGAILLVQLWPVLPGGDSTQPFPEGDGQEVIQIEEVQQTQQEEQRPPPPVPPLPIEVPDDIVLDDVEITFTDAFAVPDEPGDDAVRVEGAEEPVATGGTRRARLLRVSEPAVPDAARQRDMTARVELEIVVTPQGEVEEATIMERYLIDASGNEQRVALLGYGLEEAALEAAQRLLYRPALREGREVTERTTVSLTIGGNS